MPIIESYNIVSGDLWKGLTEANKATPETFKQIIQNKPIHLRKVLKTQILAWIVNHEGNIKKYWIPVTDILHLVEHQYPPADIERVRDYRK